jgi:hypothetical protein
VAHGPARRLDRRDHDGRRLRFGFLNHFILASPITWLTSQGHGSRSATTAVLLAGTEALASVVALQLAQRKEIMS